MVTDHPDMATGTVCTVVHGQMLATRLGAEGGIDAGNMGIDLFRHVQAHLVSLWVCLSVFQHAGVEMVAAVPG